MGSSREAFIAGQTPKTHEPALRGLKTPTRPANGRGAGGVYFPVNITRGGGVLETEPGHAFVSNPQAEVVL